MIETGVPLVQATVADAYTNALTLNCPDTTRLTIYVFNASVLYQIAYDRAGSQFYQIESDLPPGFHSLARNCSAIRFRNMIAGTPAIVSCKALQPG
jgi:hypothetical protein